ADSRGAEAPRRQAVALILLLCVSGMRAETARYSVTEEAERGSFVSNIAKDWGLTGEELPVSFTDISDHASVFLNKEIVLKIPESAMLEAQFFLESAQDPEVGNNSLQHYSISSNDYFQIYTWRWSDGRRYAELVLDRALDREQQAEVAFSVMAVDGGSPPCSGTALIHVVVLDINDNVPVFTHSLYKVQVLENSTEDTPVVVVSANDLDAGTNGEIPVDYEETKTYKIDIQATGGGGLFMHCKVEVQVEDVNNNAPEVITASLTSTLSEAALPNTIVALFNMHDQDSGDNGMTRCELLGKQPFSIRPLAADAYALVTSEALDWEEVAEYNVTVRAHDEGFPALLASKKLLLQPLDMNDNVPTFTQDVYTMVLICACLPGGGAGSRRWLAAAQHTGGATHGGAGRERQCTCCAAPAPDSSTAEGELVLCWARAGYLVAKVVMVDVDAGQNMWLLHELAKAMELGLFHMGLHSSKVRMAWAVAEHDTPRQRPVVLVRDRGQLLCSATATLSIALVDGFSDAFLQLSNAPVGRQEPQIAEEDTCLRACLASPSASCYTDGVFATSHTDVAKTDTLSLAYCYEACLSRGSERRALQFLKPDLHNHGGEAGPGGALRAVRYVHAPLRAAAGEPPAVLSGRGGRGGHQ
uniref:Protocadherin beta 4 n=1 Tax=Buteo japonicus TaxID=224669 RepID=A0A8C0C4J5_9AVES